MDGSKLCQISTGQEQDWVQLYTAAFPADERMPVELLRKSMTDGHVILHRTVNSKNELLCFSIVFLMSDSVLLSYIATDSTKRSSGVGSKHLKRLIEILKTAHPTKIGMFLEIESTKEKGLDPETLKSRMRRLAFYQRLGSKRAHKRYLMPTYGGTVQSTRILKEGELLWLEFNHGSITESVLPRIIEEIFIKGYGLAPNDPLVVKVVAQFLPVNPKATSTAASAGTVDTVLLPPSTAAGVSGTKPADRAKNTDGTPVAQLPAANAGTADNSVADKAPAPVSEKPVPVPKAPTVARACQCVCTCSCRCCRCSNGAGNVSGKQAKSCSSTVAGKAPSSR
jgi:hypothetical protein